MNTKKLRVLPLFLSFLLAPLPVRAVDVAVTPGPVRPAAAPLNFQLTPDQILNNYIQAQDGFNADLTRLVSIPASQRNFENSIRALDTAAGVYNDRIQALIFLKSVSPDSKVRDAADLVEDDANKFGVALMNREDLYQALKAYADKGETLSAGDQRLLDSSLRDFKMNGMGLAPEKREELRKVKDRLNKLSSEFERTVNEHKDQLEVSLEDLKGLPQSYIDGLDKTADGKFVVTLKYPDYVPFMQYAENGLLRKQLERKFNERGMPKNVSRLEEALRLRHQSAQILGYESYPHMILESRMAKGPERVWDFLNKLWPILRAKADADLTRLLALKQKDEPASDRVYSYDKNYYIEKERKARYDLDEEEVKKYFPVGGVIEGTMKVYQRVLGVKFTEVLSPDVWHPDVKLFEVSDPATGRRIAHFYLDLYPRDGKYTHAAAFPLIAGRDLDGGAYNAPAAAMVANFPKPVGGKPALLPHSDVETFFHEFGHIMHATLTRARYANFSGTSVAWDFVEAPSQMLENFVWQKEVLDEISGRFDDPSKKLPDELYRKMLAARRHGDGIHYARQLSLAMADMLIHQSVPSVTNFLFNQLLEMIGLVPIQRGSHMLAGFGHLMGGYGAGYYSYLWSEVFADDIFTRFKKEGLFSSVGQDYRREILEQGSQRPEEESLRAFLGREPSEKAFMEKMTAPAEAVADGPQRVSSAFIEAAKKQGLARPLEGLDDPRRKDSDALVSDNWVRVPMPGVRMVVYRYDVGERTVQAYVRHEDGREALLTFIHDGKTKRREELVRHPDGSVTRKVQEQPQGSPES